MIDDTLPADNLESLTNRHLREFRRTQDTMVDLIKRQTELMNRGFRAIDEVKSDLLLLENRTLSAIENDIFLRNEVASIRATLAQFDERFGGLEARLDALEGQLEGRLGQLEGRLGQLEGRLGQLEGRMERLEGKIDDVLALVRALVSKG
jgi:chromosome segregation ATPase